MVLKHCPVCGGQLFLLPDDTEICIDDSCGWRTPKCLCKLCQLDKCRIVAMCEMSIPPDDGNVFGKGLATAYKNVIRWIEEGDDGELSSVKKDSKNFNKGQITGSYKRPRGKITGPWGKDVRKKAGE